MEADCDEAGKRRRRLEAEQRVVEACSGTDADSLHPSAADVSAASVVAGSGAASVCTDASASRAANAAFCKDSDSGGGGVGGVSGGGCSGCGNGASDVAAASAATTLLVASAPPAAAVLQPVDDAYREVEALFRGIDDYEALRATEDAYSATIDVAQLETNGNSCIDCVGTRVSLMRLPTSSMEAFAIVGTAAGDGVFLCRRALTGQKQLQLLDKFLSEWWGKPNRSNLADQEPEKEDEKGRRSAVAKLRWVTLGRQYDWASRRYLDESPPLPEELSCISKAVCEVLPLEPHCGLVAPTFDAAICNLYHAAARPSDRLGGHQDDAEADDGSPLVSLSLGLPCVFLVGGATRKSRPTPVILYGGDALILAGGARRAYHGVPTVLSPPGLRVKALRQRGRQRVQLSREEWSAVYEPWKSSRESEDSPPEAIAELTEFLGRTRVNFSIRSAGVQ